MKTLLNLQTASRSGSFCKPWRSLFTCCGMLLLVSGQVRAVSVLEFSAEWFYVNEGTAQIEISIQRENDIQTIVNVEFATGPQYSATAGEDYTVVITSVTFLAGEEQDGDGTTILNDGLVEGFETFGLMLHNPGAGAGWDLVQALSSRSPITTESFSVWRLGLTDCARMRNSCELGLSATTTALSRLQ